MWWFPGQRGAILTFDVTFALMGRSLCFFFFYEINKCSSFIDQSETHQHVETLIKLTQEEI